MEEFEIYPIPRKIDVGVPIPKKKTFLENKIDTDWRAQPICGFIGFIMFR